MSLFKSITKMFSWGLAGRLLGLGEKDKTPELPAVPEAPVPPPPAAEPTAPELGGQSTKKKRQKFGRRSLLIDASASSAPSSGLGIY